MRTKRAIIWSAAIAIGGVLLLLDAADVYPQWLLVGPVLVGVAGVALLADQTLYWPGRKGGFVGSLLMIALSAGTVTQDALLVVDEWSVWPFVAGAFAIGAPLERFAARRRRRAQAVSSPPRAKAA